MHVLHEDEDPDTVVGKSFAETLPNGDLALLLNSIALYAFGSHDSLFWGQETCD